MNFTQDWFTHNVPNFEKCMEAAPERLKFLEIGSYEGMSACWLLTNGLEEGGHLTCIDPFFNDMRSVFDKNIREATRLNQVVSVMQTTSYKALAELIGTKQTYDFIYIDGVHSADGALTDACMSWGLLKQGGVMLFDDYLYPHEPTKVGIDGFLAAFDGKYDIIVNNYQLAVQKK
jgi:predicted O-methyltransferase YrrM